jgi:hypothetical protein
MGKADVDEILRRIDSLPEEDRLALEEQLDLRIEREWLAEMVEARRIAREQGIDQDAIDRAISEIRRGK